MPKILTPEQKIESAARRKQHMKDWYARNTDLAKQRARDCRLTYRQKFPWVKLIRGCRERAIPKGIPFDLTEDWGKDTWTGYCALSGLPFDLSVSGRSGPKPFSPSIDKIDPALGYLQSNCRFILFSLNAFKGTSTDDVMMTIAQMMLKYNNRI